MKTNLGSHDEARLEIGQMLNLLLADEYALYATTRDYHWNVTGPEFRSLHQQFEEPYEQIAQWLDDVAERACATGVGARGNWTDLHKAARSSAHPGIDLSAEDMLSELLAWHEELIVQLGTDCEACRARFKDAGTFDFLIGLREQHKKAAGIFRAQLGTVKEEALPGQPSEIQNSKSSRSSCSSAESSSSSSALVLRIPSAQVSLAFLSGFRPLKSGGCSSMVPALRRQASPGCGAARSRNSGAPSMLNYAGSFLNTALVAAVFGFAILAGTAATSAMAIFLVCLVLFMVSRLRDEQPTVWTENSTPFLARPMNATR